LSVVFDLTNAEFVVVGHRSQRWWHKESVLAVLRWKPVNTVSQRISAGIYVLWKWYTNQSYRHRL